MGEEVNRWTEVLVLAKTMPSAYIIRNGNPKRRIHLCDTIGRDFIRSALFTVLLKGWSFCYFIQNFGYLTTSFSLIVIWSLVYQIPLARQYFESRTMCQCQSYTCRKVAEKACFVADIPAFHLNTIQVWYMGFIYYKFLKFIYVDTFIVELAIRCRTCWL